MKGIIIQIFIFYFLYLIFWDLLSMGETAQKDYSLMVEKHHEPIFTVLDHSYTFPSC